MISAKLATQPSHTRSGSSEPESTMMTRPAEQSLQKIWPQRRQWCRRFQKLNSCGRPLLPPPKHAVNVSKEAQPWQQQTKCTHLPLPQRGLMQAAAALSETQFSFEQ